MFLLCFMHYDGVLVADSKETRRNKQRTTERERDTEREIERGSGNKPLVQNLFMNVGCWGNDHMTKRCYNNNNNCRRVLPLVLDLSTPS